MSEFTIKGSIDFKEYLECHKIMAAKRRTWLRSFLVLIGVSVWVHAILLSEYRPEWMMIGAGGFALLYATVISPWQFAYRVKRNWERYPLAKREFELVVTEEGVASRDDKGNLAHLNWESYFKLRETPSLFLLYVSPLMPQPIPKRLIAEQEIEELRRLLTDQMPKN